MCLSVDMQRQQRSDWLLHRTTSARIGPDSHHINLQIKEGQGFETTVLLYRYWADNILALFDLVANLQTNPVDSDIRTAGLRTAAAVGLRPSNKTDANICPFWELEKTTRMPSYYMDEDYPTTPEIQRPFHERSNHCDSESSTMETDVYVWRYAVRTASGAPCIPEKQQERREQWCCFKAVIF